MALSANTVMELNAGATASNVNGGGFNPTNANMLTDLTTDSNTANTNSPVVSSASYNFGVADEGHWLYQQKTTSNWTAGWYKIASTSGNKATLQAAIGQAIQVSTTEGMPSPRYKTNTVAGIATTGTPTGGIFTIDYSQGTAAILTKTDLTCTAGSTTIASATATFTPVMVGNLIHLTALTGTGAIVGWYEIVSYVSGTSVVLDRTPTNGVNNITAGTYYVGGAMSLNSTLDDDLFEISVATNGTGGFRWFAKNGSFSLGESVSLSAAGGTQAPIVIEGYNSLRGDLPTGSTRPTIAGGANVFTLAANWDVYSTIFTGTGATVLTVGGGGKAVNVKSTNTSTTANRSAIVGSADVVLIACEGISYRGQGINLSNVGTSAYFCWAHDSNVGFNSTSTSNMQNIIGCISSSNVTAALNFTGAMTAALMVEGCTLYGSENTTGTGFLITSGTTDARLMNNIITGFATGVSHPDVQTASYDDYNDYYNNDTDVSGWQKGSHDVALNPSFTSVGQVTFATATTSGSVVTQAGADFTAAGVVAGRDYLYLVSGTGVTAGIYGITAVGTTTLTLDIAPGTNATANKVGQITIGQNFAIGTNLKALGYPGIFPGGLTTSYSDIGAVQRQESSGGSGGFMIT